MCVYTRGTGSTRVPVYRTTVVPVSMCVCTRVLLYRYCGGVSGWLLMLSPQSELWPRLLTLHVKPPRQHTIYLSILPLFDLFAPN